MSVVFVEYIQSFMDRWIDGCFIYYTKLGKCLEISGDSSKLQSSADKEYILNSLLSTSIEARNLYWISRFTGRIMCTLEKRHTVSKILKKGTERLKVGKVKLLLAGVFHCEKCMMSVCGWGWEKLKDGISKIVPR